MLNNNQVEVVSDSQQEDEKWRRAEIVAAIVHLYYMGDETFDPSGMPRNELARLFGVKRTTVWRALKDARSALGLAEEVKRRLRPYFTDRAKRMAESKKRRELVAVTANRRAKERRLQAKLERMHR